MARVKEIFYNVDYFSVFSMSWINYGSYRKYHDACTRFQKLREAEEKNQFPRMIRLSTIYSYT